MYVNEISINYVYDTLFVYPPFVFIICVSLDVEGNLQRKVTDKS